MRKLTRKQTIQKEFSEIGIYFAKSWTMAKLQLEIDYYINHHFTCFKKFKKRLEKLQIISLEPKYRKEQHSSWYHSLTQKLYLEYVNDFLTVEKFAEYHGIEIDHATDIIMHGRRVNEGYVEIK